MEHGEDKAADNANEKPRHEDELPHAVQAKDKRRRVCGNELVGSHDENRKCIEQADEKREREAAAPGEARRAARAGPARRCPGG